MTARESLDAALAAETARWRAAGLERTLAPAAPELADFTSNDYLGLARDERVIAAGRAALAEHGAGGRASRLLGGGSPLDAAAERAAADWLGAEAALLFPTGYHANLGVLTSLAGPGDVILSDELNHASLIDAARLSRARVLVYRHGDAADAERRLALATGARRALLVTESVFSMDGDLAPLVELRAVCARLGAWLVVDEAHACGLLGPDGAGAATALARDPLLAARIVTGGKALGVAGAFAVGGARLRGHLLNRARSFVFTTALPPAVPGALVEAIARARVAGRERAHVLGLARELAAELGLPAPAGAIVPVVLGRSEDALAAAARAHEAGLDVRAVRPPTVPEGSARLRVVLHAFNTRAEVARLAACLAAPRAPATEGPRARLADLVVVAGTDTGVGKTVVSALLARAAARRGAAAYWKPVQTGAESDTAAAAGLAGLRPDALLAPAHSLRKPASPHEAAAAEGVAIDPLRLEQQLDAHRRALGGGTLVVELAGGLLVPLTDGFTQLDALARKRPPLVLVARSGVGTLNHTLLSLEALRARGLEPLALFLVGEPHASNRATLARMGGVERVLEVPLFAPLDANALERWLDAHDLGALPG